MDPTDVTPSSISANALAMVQANYGVSVMRKVIDIEAAQGAQLAQMIAQSVGLGQNVDARA